MSRTLWRIGAEAPTYSADDMTGKGAEITGGRWNIKGVPAVYAASSRSLACLETVVHYNAGGLPMNRYLVEITVPDHVWSSALALSPSSLAVGWEAEPPGKVSLDAGTNWLKAQSSALLLVPSVVVPEEFNVVINPRHPVSSQIDAVKVRRWLYDPRLK